MKKKKKRTKLHGIFLPKVILPKKSLDALDFRLRQPPAKIICRVAVCHFDARTFSKTARLAAGLFVQPPKTRVQLLVYSSRKIDVDVFTNVLVNRSYVERVRQSVENGPNRGAWDCYCYRTS